MARRAGITTVRAQATEETAGLEDVLLLALHSWHLWPPGVQEGVHDLWRLQCTSTFIKLFVEPVSVDLLIAALMLRRRGRASSGCKYAPNVCQSCCGPDLDHSRK